MFSEFQCQMTITVQHVQYMGCFRLTATSSVQAVWQSMGWKQADDYETHLLVKDIVRKTGAGELIFMEAFIVA